MMRRIFPFIAALVLLGGCAPTIGDDCETNSECPSGAICDVTAPEGYCVIVECDRESCPDGSVCVEFDGEESFCMQYCAADDECRRDGYVCREDVGPAGFCYTPLGTASGDEP